MPRRGIDRVPTGDGSDLFMMATGTGEEGAKQVRKGKKDAKDDPNATASGENK